VVYSILPGSDPAASALLGAASIIALAHAVELYRVLRELEGTRKASE